MCLRFIDPPLRGRPVHDDVNPQYLHGVQRVRELHDRGQSDEGQGGDAPGNTNIAGNNES